MTEICYCHVSSMKYSLAERCNILKDNVMHPAKGARRSSEVERSLMVRWVVGSILHGVDPLSYFSFQPVLHNWCNKGRGMLSCLWDGAYKRTLLLIGSCSLCGGSGFPFSLSVWSLTICLTPYNLIKCVECVVK